MNKWSKLWISLLALLAPMAMASVTIEKSTDVAPGIFFSELPIVTDMVCNETQVFEYTVRNNIAVTVKVNQAIEILNGDDDVVSMFISGGTCGILPSFSLTPGESCTIDVTAISEPCPESKAPASTLVRRALVLVPSTTVQRNPLTSRILFEVVPGPTIAGLTAYIANDDNTNSVSMCPVDESDGSLLTCTVLNDSTFNAPADVILTPKGALTDGATMAYVANSDNDTISVCPVNEDGTFGFCKTPAFSGSFELAFPGLRLSADNTFLYATDYYNDLVWQCPVAADGSLGGACTSFGGDPVSGAFNGPKGRMVLNLANTQTYIPNFNPSNVSICDSVFVTCTTFDDSSAFNSPLGLDIDVSGSYVYVA
ncbi:MAG TPA: hypothetical protein VI522_02490, partial [Gammaproteobacteria bacterium]|nr:hypothetical protein [Gammaproteobacteria bacterium]